VTLAAEILDKLPELPHWRWVLWHQIDKGSHPEACNKIKALAQWSKVRWPDWDEMIFELEIDQIQAWFIEGDLHPLTRVRELYFDKAASLHLKRCLSANLPSYEIARLVNTKLGLEGQKALQSVHVDLFRDVFFDLENVGLKGALNYMKKRNLAWQEIWCPLPNEFRAAWARFKCGSVPSVDGNLVINQMLMQAFQASELAIRSGIHNEASAINWQNQALKILKASKDLGYSSGGGGKLPDHLVVEPEEVSEIEELPVIDHKNIVRRTS